ncbi:MAG: hypothetical protein K0S76_713 [Herbinix sp.]|jgi:hypothetical protein|nr:hypothetical protein [Herbinix sp.]
MYFEPSKKTYYRFPSTNSINDLDSRYYFPEKPIHTEFDARLETTTSTTNSNRDSFQN